MRCLFTKRLFNQAYDGNDPLSPFWINVPCGKCYACLANRRRSWLFRLQMESLRSYPWFGTLTYDDVNCDGLLHKEHVDSFISDMRSAISFKYYLIGEYGTNTYRPHYHFIFFVTIDTNDVPDIVSAMWRRGFVDCVRATYQRLNYVLHYHVRPKQVNGKKTFARFSNGLGDNFIYDDERNFRSDILNYLQSCRYPIVQDFEGNYYVIPRYFVKKIQDAGYPVSSAFNDINYFTALDDAVIRSLGVDDFYRVPFVDKLHLINDYYNLSNQKVNRYDNQDKFI